MQKTIIYSSPRRTTTTLQRELVEIELSGDSLPQDSYISTHIATITLRKNDGKAARFFVRVLIEDGRPFAILSALNTSLDENPERELRGKWEKGF